MNGQELMPQEKNPQEIHHSLTKKKIILFAVIIDLIILAIVAIYFLKADMSTGQSGLEKIRSEISGNKSVPSPTPFPFQELTIPYLRNKTYSSKLEKQEIVSESTVYTSHVATYESDGYKIRGLLTVPNGEVPAGGHPAIVFVHGYIPPSQYSTTGSAYSAYVDYLARAGFVVFKIDLRGHGESEGEAGGGYFGSDYIVDTLNAYSALEKSTFVNPKKIGLWGHSMAGNILLRSVAVKSEIPAASIWAGAVFTYMDREKYGINDASFQMSSLSPDRQSRRRQLIEKYGEPSEESTYWRMVIPTNYLNDFKGAIQLNHAVDDTVVDVGYSRDLNAFLDKTSVPHELNEYSAGGHDIEGESFVGAMEKSVSFFKKYLSG